ncbi:MAG: hypothetical protein HC877_03000 [Thioploca sp.]|nr:hypothetical protein [Thioploca sp.]
MPSVLAATDCTTITDPSLRDECQALIDLYNNTNGPNWFDHSSNNWNVTNTPCIDWAGITCDGGYIIGISREKQNLKGSISDLSALTYLESLNLSDNQLIGLIPDFLSSLTSLVNLQLDHNQLTGSIPDLSGLEFLAKIQLDHNQLIGPIPNCNPSDCSFPSLQVLSLGNNPLENGIIPDWIGSLTKLNTLDLSDSGRTGTIPDLSALVNLQHLNLSKNFLRGQIEIHSNMINLISLQLDHNQLTGAIPNCSSATSSPPNCNLSTLQVLSLGNNPLENGIIPDWIGSLTKLTRLDLSNSGRTGTIPNLRDLTDLQYLDLSNNRLSGPIQTEILNKLTKLENLQLDHNQLTGAIPNFPNCSPTTPPKPPNCNLSNLQVLYLGDNFLESGPIPDWIKYLSNLRTLGLSNSQRTGEIPKWINNLTNLEYLQLDHNQLKGSIPDLSKLTQLKWLFLNNNHLNNNPPEAPPIPNLSKLTALKILYLQSNKLSGQIPTSLSKLTKLEHLNLGYNGLIAQDRTLLTFLNEKNPTWEWTQTVPPTDIKTKMLSRNSIEISWKSISYTGDGGYYQVKYATAPNGEYIPTSSTTVSKNATNYIVNELLPETTYYFVVETYTPPHELNPGNDLTSEPSPPVSANTIIPSLTPLPPTMNLTIAFGGDGHGQVTTNPSGLDCDSLEQKCSYSYETASWVELIATPAAGSAFTGWGGYQSDCDNGELFMSGYRYCMAYFERLRFPLIVTVVGQGKVSSMPIGIDCGTRCRYRFEINTPIALTTIAAANWQFEKWQGDCNANSLLIMDKEKQCEAVFIAVSPNTISADINGVPPTPPSSNPASNLTVSNNQPILTDQCSNSLNNPANNCSVTVVPQPVLAEPEITVPVPPTIAPDLPAAIPTETVNSTANDETAVPQLVVNPGVYNFDNLTIGNISPAQEITITNAGNADLPLGQLTVSSNEFVLAEACSNQRLNAGNHCAAMVSFQPQLTGIKTAYLAIPIDNPMQTTVTVVTLTGKGNAIKDQIENTGYLVSDNTIDLPLLVTFTSPLVATVTPAGVELYWEIAETNHNQIAEIHLWKAKPVKGNCPQAIHQYDLKTATELANQPHLDYQGTDTTCYGLQVIEYNGDVTWYITQAQ